jgi:hypothetical protein
MASLCTRQDNKDSIIRILKLLIPREGGVHATAYCAFSFWHMAARTERGVNLVAAGHGDARPSNIFFSSGVGSKLVISGMP